MEVAQVSILTAPKYQARTVNKMVSTMNISKTLLNVKLLSLVSAVSAVTPFDNGMVDHRLSHVISAFCKVQIGTICQPSVSMQERPGK